MDNVIFDTLNFVETLKAAGIPEAHAKAIAQAQRHAFAQVATHNLATKSDIAELRF